MEKDKLSFGSICIHDEKPLQNTAAHQLPIFATSSFEFASIDQGMEIFTGASTGHFYSRFSNPTVDEVARKITQLEAHNTGHEASGLMTSSGMSAISTVVLGLLKQGDKILTQGNLYGGTTELFTRIIQSFGVEIMMTDLRDLNQVEDLVAADPNIRMIYFETPANPSLMVVDMEGIAGIAEKHQCYTVVDNTFCTPYLQQPLKFGIDFVIHSTTKYLNGHGNATAGAIVGKHLDLMKEKVWPALKLVGTNSNPWDAWLTNNGLKTLPLRMDKHSQNAQLIAQFLEWHPHVSQVNYCGLSSHPQYALAKKQMAPFGGMLSFELKGGLEAGIRFMRQIKFCTLAPTLGDVDTLILHPASMSHLNIPKEVRMANGITDGLIRVSVGIEPVEDILNDLRGAMSTV